jgi:secreted trypsin-like serine protease
MLPVFHLLLLASGTLAAPSDLSSLDTFSAPANISFHLPETDDDSVEERSLNSCGCAAVSAASGRIVAGQASPKDKLPYQVMVTPCEGAACSMCGGTILNKRYILTAAHCLPAGVTKITVDAGVNNWCTEIGQKIPVYEMEIHPKYSTTTFDNDIAILKLSKDLTFSDSVKPACLPSSATQDYSNTWAQLSGWGGTKAYNVGQTVKQETSCTLKETVIQILGPKEKKCAAMLKHSKIAGGTSQLCAWAEGTDACQGDSGGPLTVNQDDKYTLVGVVSYGFGCATSHPGMFARVQHYLPWIQSKIKDGECSAASQYDYYG